MVARLQIGVIIARAVDNLLESRYPQGHWGDVRATALATWALSEVLASGGAAREVVPELRAALRNSQMWLSSQARRDDRVGVNWESEAWDTALATIALSSNSMFVERVEEAASWLQHVRYEGTGCWYDEVWETTLATVALLRAERVRKGPPGHARWLAEVLQWLVQIPSKDSGEFVCPHYSGFIVWLLAEVGQTRLRSQIVAAPAYAAFQDKANRAVAWLLQQQASNPSHLWSNYTFSNAYIAYALSLHWPAGNLDTPFESPFAQWLQERQGNSGGFEDTEDTAAVVLALSSMLRRSPEEADPLFAMLSRSNSVAACHCQTCFLGYSSSAKQIADDLISFFRTRLPSVTFQNWRWDFQPGTLLFAELEMASHKCGAAIFLLTADDMVDTPGGLALAPRDNIVFEAGYFAARLGAPHTTLVVEDGAKLPTDLGGMLYVPLKDRGRLDPV